ncbi:hypothetical protein BB559_003900 [Furculomyces boomerangus]|uniref:Methyltransferase type 11 domain-containing protein n=1 Tax=Furculomyces boomerangus TaxID=61424 RepID=A0A2T9YI24_9FUNG|nr:hypothetical protein BB559_003900 [Furculomyces boomerangus]
MTTFNKLFYNHAKYASQRPSYNPQLADYLIKYHLSIPGNVCDVVVDAATGSGIFARLISKHFKSVFATDVSAKMLSVATQSEDGGAPIQYIESGAESMPMISDSSVDMITVATGAHWFNPEKFLQEARRILKPNGTIAIFGISYGYFPDYPQCDKLIFELGFEKLGKYWDPGTHILDGLYSKYNTLMREQGFKDVYMGYHPHQAKLHVGPNGNLLDEPYVINTKLTWGSLLNYISTWSSIANYHLDHPNERNIAEVYVEKIMSAAGETDMDAPVRYDWGQSLVICRK